MSKVFEDYMWKQKSDSTGRSKEKKIMIIASFFVSKHFVIRENKYGKWYDFAAEKDKDSLIYTKGYRITFKYNKYKGNKVYKVRNDRYKVILNLYRIPV